MSNVPATLPGVDPPLEVHVEQLCAQLAEALHERLGRRPTVTHAWRRDMRLLCERGPLGAARAPEPPERVAKVIGATFECETWWADRITSPGFLRKHYLRITKEAATAYKRRSAKPSTGTVDMIGKLRSL